MNLRSIGSIIEELQGNKCAKYMDKKLFYDASKEKYAYTCIADDGSWNIFIFPHSGILSEHEFAHDMYININNGSVNIYDVQHK